jgi:hypothetical protein
MKAANGLMLRILSINANGLEHLEVRQLDTLSPQFNTNQ